MKKLSMLLLVGLMFSCGLTPSEPIRPEETLTTKCSSLSGLEETLRNFNERKITSFIEDGKDETFKFTSFTFNFQSNGQLVATSEGQTFNGTYRVFCDDGKLELSMSFPANSPLRKLNDDWYFLSQSGKSLLFEDDGDQLTIQ